MTTNDTFDATLSSWLDDKASAPVAREDRERVLEAIVTRQPRPARLASLGSHWISERVSARTRPGGLGMSLPALRIAPALLLLLLLALALLGTAALIGGQLLDGPREPGRLAFELDGSIYLADADGRNPNWVAGSAAAGRYDPAAFFLLRESIWAPDGRHFLYHENAATHISDADGRSVASIAAGTASWSPDSSLVAVWPHSMTFTVDARIRIFNLDGVEVAALPYPTGYVLFRENLGSWAPEGRSVLLQLTRPDVPGDIREVVELPIDGSAPRQVPLDSPLASTDLNVARDGTRIAYSSDGDVFWANSDGSGIRNLDVGFNPVWSPNGAEIAYLHGLGPEGITSYDLRVIDVASGAVRTVVADFKSDPWPNIAWSARSDRLLFTVLGEQDTTSLWSVGANGGAQRLLVKDAPIGAWQWVAEVPIESPPPATTSPAAPPSPASSPAEIPSPTPRSPVPSPSPASSSSTTPFIADVIPAVGALAPGTYTYAKVDRVGVNVRFTVPGGWSWDWDGRSLRKDGVGLPAGAAITFFGGAVQVEVFADPCHWTEGPSAVPTNTIDGVVAALAGQPSRSPTVPTERRASGLIVTDLWPGKMVDLTVPSELDLASCDEGEYRSWSVAGVSRSHEGPGQRDRVWVIDVDGIDATGQSGPGGIIIDASSFPNTSPTVMAEIDAILDSIRLGHWG